MLNRRSQVPKAHNINGAHFAIGRGYSLAINAMQFQGGLHGRPDRQSGATGRTGHSGVPGRLRHRKDHCKYGVGGIDTTIIVATLRNDHHFALRPKLLINVFHEGLPSGPSCCTLRHRRR